MSYALKSVTPKRWKVLFGLFLAEELHYARPGYSFNFFVYPYETRYDNWWYYNGLFSGLWKIPWISIQGDTHDVCCLHSICPVCCMAEGLSMLDRIVLPEVLNQVTSFPRGHLAIPGVIFGCHDLCDELLLASSVYRLRVLLKILSCKTAPFNKRLIQPPVLIVLRLRSLC